MIKIREAGRIGISRFEGCSELRTLGCSVYYIYLSAQITVDSDARDIIAAVVIGPQSEIRSCSARCRIVHDRGVVCLSRTFSADGESPSVLHEYACGIILGI